MFGTEHLLQMAAHLEEAAVLPDHAPGTSCPPRPLLLGQQALGRALSTESDPAAGLGSPQHGDVAEIGEAGAYSPPLNVLERSWLRRPQADPDQHPRRLTLGTQRSAIEMEPA